MICTRMAVTDEESLQEISDFFNHFDKDKDGQLNAKELKNLWRAWRQDPTEEEIKAMLGNENGKLSFDQVFRLLGGVEIEQRLRKRKQLIDSLKIFDTHQKNYLTFTELTKAIDKFGWKISESEIHIVRTFFFKLKKKYRSFFRLLIWWTWTGKVDCIITNYCNIQQKLDEKCSHFFLLKFSFHFLLNFCSSIFVPNTNINFLSFFVKF